MNIKDISLFLRCIHLAKLIMAITLRGLLTVVALLCFHFSAHAAETDSISRRCVSESGLSIYDIHLDLTLRNGEIRYRFMGQDVFYDVTIERVEDRTIFGVAVFSSSRSGETRANPFSFTYDIEQNTFKEAIVFNCSEN